MFFFFFSSRRRHTRSLCDWSSDVCSSDLFYLEQELLKPRYEIHSIGMPDVVEPTEESKAEQKDRAARALFSATEMVSGNKFETEFGRTVPQTKYWEYAQRYQKQLLEQVQRLSERLSRAYAE